MGVTLVVRGSVLGNIYDDFNRPDGPLAGSITTLGGRVWTRVGSNGTRASISNQQVRNTEGADTNSDMFLLDIGTANFDLAFLLAEVRSPSAIHTIPFRVHDADNHYAILLRKDTVTPGYCIARRFGGVYDYRLVTTVIPQKGDRVGLVVRDDTAQLFVNGASIGTGNVEGWMDNYTLGIRTVGADQITAFDNFAISTKAP